MINWGKWHYYLKSIASLLFGFKNWLLVLVVFLKKPDQKVRKVTLKQSGLQLNVRGKMDVWSIKETFLDQFYEKYGTSLKENWTVLDVGAAIGEFSIWAAKQIPKGKVFAYEPFPDSFKLLSENISLNAVENICMINKALWSHESVITLNTTQGEPLKVWSQQEMDAEDRGGSTTAQTISLLQALNENDIQQLDLLKLDCEGAEFPILLEAHAHVWECVIRIVLEYHDGFEGHDHTELVSLLQNRGYAVHLTPNIVHKNLGYLYAEKEMYTVLQA